VGGEVVFEPGYEQNCLVNAMCVGVPRRPDRLQSARAAGAGNLVVLFGARTGRDGIGGASVLASQDLDEGDEKRPTVQVGDPFTGKRLIECSLELVERDVLVSLQDLGAAGLASSSAEMAARGAMGLVLDLDRVPVREDGMEPFEIMISESQERMLAVVEPDRLEAVAAICARWELACTAVGELVDGDHLVCRMHGESWASCPCGPSSTTPRATASTPSAPTTSPTGRSIPTPTRRPPN
jgi:phosphoribosylformylglycinamidine synthase